VTCFHHTDATFEDGRSQGKRRSGTELKYEDRQGVREGRWATFSLSLSLLFLRLAFPWTRSPLDLSVDPAQDGSRSSPVDKGTSQRPSRPPPLPGTRRVQPCKLGIQGLAGARSGLRARTWSTGLEGRKAVVFHRGRYSSPSSASSLPLVLSRPPFLL